MLILFCGEMPKYLEQYWNRIILGLITERIKAEINNLKDLLNKKTRRDKTPDYTPKKRPC